jgi:hypothetical protein
MYQGSKLLNLSCVFCCYIKYETSVSKVDMFQHLLYAVMRPFLYNKYIKFQNNEIYIKTQNMFRYIVIY